MIDCAVPVYALELLMFLADYSALTTAGYAAVAVFIAGSLNSPLNSLSLIF